MIPKTQGEQSKRQREQCEWICYWLYAVSLASLGLALGGGPTVSPHIVIVLAAVLPVVLHPYLADSLQPKVTWVGYTAFSLPFAILSRIWPAEGGGIFDFNTLFYGAMFAEMASMIRFYRARNTERYRWVLLGSMTGLAATGGALDQTPYMILTVLFGLGLVAFLRVTMHERSSGRRGRRRLVSTLVVILLLLVTTSMAIGVGVNHYYYSLDRTFVRWIMRQRLVTAVGFSEKSELGSIPELQMGNIGEEVALRVFSGGIPGYLRGRVAITYGAGKWMTAAKDHDIQLTNETNRDATSFRYTLPGRPEPSEFALPSLRVYPSSRYGAHFFLPLEASGLESASPSLRISPGSILKSTYKSTAGGYGVFTDPGVPVFDQLPEGKETFPVADQTSVDPRLGPKGIPPNPFMHAALDRKISFMEEAGWLKPDRAGASIDSKIRAVQRYFASEYTYKIGIDLEGADPIYVFLEKRRHGHCELFATAGVMLLRRLNIPARYVTGFVCQEKNPVGDIYLARNKHAHAWVEYFDTKRGWQTAEFTPGNGLPEIQSSSGMTGWLEYLRAQWERMIGFFRREGLSGALTLFLEYVAMAGNWILESWIRTILSLILFASFFYYRLRRGKKKKQDFSWKQRTLTGQVAEMQAEFLDLEKELRRLGLGKGEAETLLEYADRLERSTVSLSERAAKVAFVREYAAIRYAKTP